MSEWTDRQLLPNNILDRMQALEGRVKDLERMAARPGRGPGQVAYYEEDGALRPDSGLIVGTDVQIEAGYRLVSEGAAFMGAVGMLMMFPGLRGLWPMSPTDSSGSAIDVSGQGRHMTPNGNPRYATHELAPYANLLSSVPKYFTRPDEAGLDILGTEAYLQPAYQGLTLGGWFRFTDTPGNVEFMIAKRTGGGTDRSYGIIRAIGGSIEGSVSNDGTNLTTISSSDITSAGSWCFAAMKYDPSTELVLWMNSERAVNTTSIPASLFNSATAFSIGATATAGLPMNGDVSLCWLCAAAVPDVMIEAFYEQSKRLFE